MMRKRSLNEILLGKNWRQICSQINNSLYEHLDGGKRVIAQSKITLRLEMLRTPLKTHGTRFIGGKAGQWPTYGLIGQKPSLQRKRRSPTDHQLQNTDIATPTTIRENYSDTTKTFWTTTDIQHKTSEDKQEEVEDILQEWEEEDQCEDTPVTDETCETWQEGLVLPSMWAGISTAPTEAGTRGPDERRSDRAIIELLAIMGDTGRPVWAGN